MYKEPHNINIEWKIVKFGNSKMEMETNRWLKFFSDAGLPDHVSANYAIIFTENRMQVDMLMDLSKEYLYDMGIRLMGDVIAILRHARTAYTEAAQEKMMTVTMPIQRPAVAATHKIKVTDNYENSYGTTSSIRPNAAAPEIVREIRNRPLGVKKMISLKRKVDGNRVTARAVKKPRTNRMTGSLSDYIKVEKVQTSKSVFNRLGESSVSSSTDAVGRKVGGASIFARLGPTKAGTTSDDEEEAVGDELQYRGIFKSSAPQPSGVRSRLGSKIKPVSAPSVTTTMSPDPVRLIRKSLEDSRMQRQTISADLATLRKTSAVQKNAYRVVKKPKNESSVFNRLGPVYPS